MAFRDIDRNVLLSPKAQTRSYTADSAVLQGQIVSAAGEDRVAPSTTDGDADVVGIALFDAAAESEVTVAESGSRVIATAATLVDAGDLVTSHGDTGEAGEVTTAAAGDYALGRAVRDAVGSNDDVEITLEPIGVAEESA